MNIFKTVLLAFVILFTTTILNAQTVWTSRTSAADNTWQAVTYGNGLFVAIANSGTGNRVMTSTDGINWTIRSSAADNSWNSVTFGNGLFVAVASTGTGNRVMTSPDGINWTIRSSAADNSWQSVAFGNNLFVAIAMTGTGNSVMTSPDGITWTTRTSAADNNWRGITYGNGLFVAVSVSGTGNRVMTSPDGINWTIRTSAADNSWRGITYGNNLFVAVAFSSPNTGDRVMTSPDGVTWTIRTSAADNNWFAVSYGNGLFVASAGTGTGNRIMTSPNGINWTIRSSTADNSWFGITFGNGLFVAVSASGTGNRVMTSGTIGSLPIELIRFTGKVIPKTNILEWETATETNNKGFNIERSTDGIRFEKISFVAANGTTNQRMKYKYEDKIVSSMTHYYRLKQLDNDERYTYSNIIVLTNQLNNQVSIYPNHVKDLLTISGATIGTKAIITDVKGKVSQTIFITQNSFTIDISTYSSGIYFLKMDNGSPQKIIKQ